MTAMIDEKFGDGKPYWTAQGDIFTSKQTPIIDLIPRLRTNKIEKSNYLIQISPFDLLALIFLHCFGQITDDAHMPLPTMQWL